MQALILAAGMGKRLGSYTSDNTKCMLRVGDKTLIERNLEALYEHGIKRVIIVIGYKGLNLKKYLLDDCDNPVCKKFDYVFINNDVYYKTNSIYSLFLAREEFMKDDTILLESDLIYDYDIIGKLIKNKNKNLAAVSEYQQWMDGTGITLDNKKNILSFIEKWEINFNCLSNYYKTVNIYKFSKDFINKEYVPFLESYVKSYGNNEYYELVLKVIISSSRCKLKGLDVSLYKWYEIDDVQDLDIANCIFSNGIDKLHLFEKRYGGYWRFNILDFCYLVNSYFPSSDLLSRINCYSEKLIRQYPSSQNVICNIASRLFSNIDGDYLAVGNGAAELISVLGRILDGNMLISKSVFHEYVRCFSNCNFDIYDLMKNNFCYDLNYIHNRVKYNDIICIVNPDNPTGAFIKYEDIISLIDFCYKKNKMVIFDESFIDFTNSNDRYSLIDKDILDKYDNLIVIKSISKSYGVPGLRLGVLATSNEKIMMKIRDYLSIWNINSYAEYYLQILNIYKNDYVNSCNRVIKDREVFIDNLRKFNGIKVYDSEANFVLCDLGKNDSTLVASELLERNIFIKDLKTKEAFKDMNFIRLSVRNNYDNQLLVKNLDDVLKLLK